MHPDCEALPDQSERIVVIFESRDYFRSPQGKENMRTPRLPFPLRQPHRERRTEISAHPVAFGAVTSEGLCLAEATIPRNVLHELMEAAKQQDLGTLAWIGLHGVTRLSSEQAKHLARDLSTLRGFDQRIPGALIETVERAGSRTDLELVIAAGL